MLTLKEVIKDGYLAHKKSIDFVASTALSIVIPVLLGAPIVPVINGIFVSGIYNAVVDVVLKKYTLQSFIDEIEDPELKAPFTKFANGELGSEDALNKALNQREEVVYKALCDVLNQRLLVRLANVEELKQVNELIRVAAKAHDDKDPIAFSNEIEKIKGILGGNRATYTEKESAVLFNASIAYTGYGSYAERIYHLTNLLQRKTEDGFGTKDANVGKLTSMFDKLFKGELKSEDLEGGDVGENELIAPLRNIVKFEEEKAQIEMRKTMFNQCKQVAGLIYIPLMYASDLAVFKSLVSATGSKTFDFSLGNFSFGSYLPEVIKSQKIPFFEFDGTKLGFGKLALTALANTAYKFAGEALSKLISPTDSKESFVANLQSSILMTLLGNGIHQAFVK